MLKTIYTLKKTFPLNIINIFYKVLINIDACKFYKIKFYYKLVNKQLIVSILSNVRQILIFIHTIIGGMNYYNIPNLTKHDFAKEM